MNKFNAHWEKLRLFYQIATVGSFSRAAETLNTSQSALSRSIITLEKHINIKLFERVPRGLILTRQGEILFESLKKITTELNQAQACVEEEENEPMGFIRVAATAGFAALHLSVIMPEFLQCYPKIHLSIYGNDVIPNLHSDEVDAVISPFIADDASLIQSYLTTFHLKLYASEAYLQRYGEPKTLSDLDHHQLLAYGDHKTLHPFGQANWHLTAKTKNADIRKPYVMVNSAIGLFNFAIAGTGIISLSKEHPALKDSRLIEILPSVEGPKIDAYFIYSARNKKIKRMAVLKDFLVKKFNNEFMS